MTEILLVDDDVFVCNFLADCLQGLECRVSVAPTLGDGLRESRSKAYDLVFLDVGLPNGSGLDAIASLRSGPGNPEVIIVTGRADVAGAELALRYGAWDYLAKPLTPAEVRLPVLRALDYRRAGAACRRRSFQMEGPVSMAPAMKACLEKAADAASSDVPVLVVGETGTGKELFARAIHDNSSRRAGPFVTLDCTVLPENLVESQLFGHEKGAFTGADRSRTGLVAQAHQGTLFLDEVGDLPSGAQAKLLRVLQEKVFRPLGGKEEVSSDFRLVSATHRDLSKMAVEGRFRHDLLYRISGLVIQLPPLRQRKEDILALVQYFLAQHARKEGGFLKGIAPDFLEALQAFDWPGNVRELFHVLATALAACGPRGVLFHRDLPWFVRVKVVQGQLTRKSPLAPTASSSEPADLLDREPFPTLKAYRRCHLGRLEKRYLEEALVRCAGDMEKACTLTGLSRSRLYALLKRHSLPAAEPPG